MGCSPENNVSPTIIPLATDPIFYKFKESWLKLKQINETKPYNPDDEVRNHLRSQELFRIKNKSNFNIF